MSHSPRPPSDQPLAFLRPRYSSTDRRLAVAPTDGGGGGAVEASDAGEKLGESTFLHNDNAFEEKAETNDDENLTLGVANEHKYEHNANGGKSNDTAEEEEEEAAEPKPSSITVTNITNKGTTTTAVTTANSSTKNKRKRRHNKILRESSQWIREMEVVRDRLCNDSIRNNILLDFLAMQGLDDDVDHLVATTGGSEDALRVPPGTSLVTPDARRSKATRKN